MKTTSLRALVLHLMALALLFLIITKGDDYWRKKRAEKEALEWLPMCSVQGNYWVKLDQRGVIIARKNRDGIEESILPQ